MLKKITLVLIGICFSQWILLSQTSEQKTKQYILLGFPPIFHIPINTHLVSIFIPIAKAILIFQEIPETRISRLQKELIKQNLKERQMSLSQNIHPKVKLYLQH